MSRLVELIKATAIGGLLFLIPVVTVAAILGKAFQLMKRAAQPLEALVPLEATGGILLANTIVGLAILLLCLLAGLVARSAVGRHLGDRLESWLTATLPFYSIVKGFTAAFRRSDEAAHGFQPVLVTFDDNAQVAFEVERTPEGKAIVYLPGAPNPWSGAVVQVEVERVQALDLTVAEALKSIQRLGASPAPHHG